MAESFELTEKPNSNNERTVGLIISVIAVALAIVSSAAHESQNDEIVENVKSSDKYALYESRKDRSLQLQLSIDSAQKIDLLSAELSEIKSAQNLQATEARGLTDLRQANIHGLKPVRPVLTNPATFATDSANISASLFGPSSSDPVLAAYKNKLDHEASEGEKDLAAARELDESAEKTARKASILDIAEIALQVSIVMCSITVLTEIMIFVRMGVVSALVGVIIALYAAFFMG